MQAQLIPPAVALLRPACRISDLTITIDRTLARPNSGNSCGKSRIWKSTQTNQKREILISPKMKTILTRYQGKGDQLIFTLVEGSPINDRSLLTRLFKPTQETLGIIPVRVHYAIRHTWAQLALSNGMDASQCAYWLGHSVELFLNQYIYAQLP